MAETARETVSQRRRPVPPVAERSTAEKTSAVHFMRFEFTQKMKDALTQGATLSFGCNHDGYPFKETVADSVRGALLMDLA